MVARGDLGVEIGDPELVGVQKKLIRRSRQLKPCGNHCNSNDGINDQQPNANSCRSDGRGKCGIRWYWRGNASAETAAGQYPAETVATMARVCLGAEKMPSINISKHRLDREFSDIADL